MMKIVDFMGYPLVCLLCCSLLLNGCGKKESGAQRAVREAQIGREVESAYNDIQQLRFENKMEEALERIDSVVSNPEYSAHAGRFLSDKIDILMELDKLDEAKGVVIKAWQEFPEAARACFGVIRNHLRQNNKHEEVREWCATLLAPTTKLPAELRSQVVGWKLEAALSSGDVESAKKEFDEIVAGMPTPESAALLSHTLTTIVESKEREKALPLLQHLEGVKTPELANMLLALRLRYHLAAHEWDALAPLYGQCLEQLPDEQLNEECRNLFVVLQKSGKMKMLEDFSKQLAFGKSGKISSINYAARTWVLCGINAKVTELPERLDALIEANISPTIVGNLFDRYFYELADRPKTIAKLCQTGDKLIQICADTNIVNDIKVKVLDGAFITANYDLAVTMLERGIPGKDENWHAMSLPKVKAHRALTAKEPREAVKYFRQFMDAWVESGQEEEFDPTTGIAHSREWILGRNAKRIAEILEAIPDKKAAGEALDEARKYFKTALEKAAKDPEALKLLQEETEGVL